MPKFISDVINTINNNSNFEFDFDMLKNPVPQDDAEACRKYKTMLDEHIDQVQAVWFKDTFIEDRPILKFTTEYGPSEGWGDYYLVSADNVDHGSYVSGDLRLRPLRDIAKDEYDVDPKELADIDTLIQLHDRSRYSEDEFYAAANYHFGTSDNTSYMISQLKHYQRNAHEFTHYMYHKENGPTRTRYDSDGNPVTVYRSELLTMPDPYLWCRIAVWLANFNAPDYKYNLNNGYNPFQYYWGRDSNYKWEWVVPEAGEGEEPPAGHWEKVLDDTPARLPDLVELPGTLQNQIELYVDRWSQVIPEPQSEPEE